MNTCTHVHTQPHLYTKYKKINKSSNYPIKEVGSRTVSLANNGARSSLKLFGEGVTLCFGSERHLLSIPFVPRQRLEASRDSRLRQERREASHLGEQQ